MCVVHPIPQFSSAIHKFVLNSILQLQHISSLLISFLGWEIWPPYRKGVLLCVLLVYANLIFALLMCQSYKSYLVHRISILYHGDDNVDCNILCLESVHIIPMSIFQWFMCPKIIPTCTHSSFDASLAYVTNVWF